MSAGPSTSRSGGSLRGWALAGVAAVLTVLLVIAIGGDGRGGAALSPTSDERLGTSAMVALAGELGAEVEVSDRLPDLGADDAPQIVVLFLDLLDDGQRDALEDWIDAGGTLVVTDPVSTFTPPMTGEFDTIDDLAPAPRMAATCDIDALARHRPGRHRPPQRRDPVRARPGRRDLRRRRQRRRLHRRHRPR